ncbi:MAG: DUF1566 domain-containing protein, partial [Bacteroidales bacterium]|nr:DUF1566 domain-containing protein [Bacteroidales bacterium]
MRKIIFLAILFFLINTITALADFVDNGDGTVTDTATGLMWQKTTQNVMNWEAAITYCETLPLANYGDWRLPNRNELQSLVDYSKYNPCIDTTFFPGTVSSYYWSSTTSAYNSGYACCVYFYYGYFSHNNKSSSYYVRAVRGGQSGSLGDLVVSDIPSPQAVDNPVEVTIRAFDTHGTFFSGFNGKVTLWSNAGDWSISPTEVTLVNGQWTGDIRFYEAGNGIILSCTSGSITGLSNPFTVNGLSSNLGSIGGEIFNNGNMLIQEDVRITLQAESIFHSQIFNTGTYIFQDIESGNYLLTAEHVDTGKTSFYYVFVPGDYRNTSKDITITFCAGCEDKIPVLLVPGMMGSESNDNGSRYPVLPKGSPEWNDETNNRIKIYEKVWTTLKEKLVNDGYKKGCTFFEAPYDWRYDLNNSKDKYLKNWINEAKLKSGKDKVDIIAHSMGGLLTRAYIQGLENDSDVDINKFAMVGTPNMGSANAYYLWEGGDPKLADDITDDFGPIDSSINAYWGTTKRNYKESEGGNLKSDENEKIWNYYTTKKSEGVKNDGIYGLKQLLPTYSFLGQTELKQLEKVTNDFLIKLNSDSNKLRMGKPGAGKIDTVIFCSSSEETISSINVGKPHSNDKFYKDGSPLGKKKSAMLTEESGDGTVPESSADFPYRDGDGWAEKHKVSGAHSKLVNNSADDLIEFLNGTLVYSQSAPVEKTKSTLEPEGTGNLISLSIRGRAQPYLTAPSGLTSGINPISGLRENNILETKISENPDSSYITIKNVQSGTYTLQLKNVYDEDFDL